MAFSGKEADFLATTSGTTLADFHGNFGKLSSVYQPTTHTRTSLVSLQSNWYFCQQTIPDKSTFAVVSYVFLLDPCKNYYHFYFLFLLIHLFYSSKSKLVWEQMKT